MTLLINLVNIVTYLSPFPPNHHHLNFEKMHTSSKIITSVIQLYFTDKFLRKDVLK